MFAREKLRAEVPFWPLDDNHPKALTALLADYFSLYQSIPELSQSILIVALLCRLLVGKGRPRYLASNSERPPIVRSGNEMKLVATNNGDE